MSLVVPKLLVVLHPDEYGVSRAGAVGVVAVSVVLVERVNPGPGAGRKRIAQVGGGEVLNRQWIDVEWVGGDSKASISSPGPCPPPPSRWD